MMTDDEEEEDDEDDEYDGLETQMRSSPWYVFF